MRKRWVRPKLVWIVFAGSLLLLAYVWVGWYLQLGGQSWRVLGLSRQILLLLSEQANDRGITFFWLRLVRHSIPILGGIILGYGVVGRFAKQLYGLPAAEVDHYLPPRWLARPPAKVNIDRTQLVEQKREHGLLRVGGPGKIKVSIPDVVITERAGRFSRILVPGEKQLQPFEYVGKVIEVKRHHETKQDVVAITRRGFRVNVDIEVEFEIDGCVIKGKEGKAHIQIQENNLRKAAYAETIYEQGVLYWHDLPMAIALEQMAAEIARRNIEDVVDHFNGRFLLLNSAISKKILEETRYQMRKHGVHVRKAGITSIRLEEPFDAAFIAQWERRNKEASIHRIVVSTESADQKRQKIREQMLNNLARSLSSVQDRATYNKVFAASRLEMQEVLRLATQGALNDAPPSPILPVEYARANVEPTEPTAPADNDEYVTVRREKLERLYQALKRNYTDDV